MINTYTLTSMTAPKSRRSLGRTPRHALMAAIEAYQPGQVVSVKGEDFSGTFKVTSGPERFTAIEIPTAQPVKVRKSSKVTARTVTIETAAAIVARKAHDTIPAPAPTEPAHEVPLHAPSKVGAWLASHGYSLPASKPAEVQPPAISAQIAKNASPAQLVTRTVKLSKPAPAEKPHPVLTEAYKLARLESPELVEFVIAHGREICAEMGKPMMLSSGPKWAEHIRTQPFGALQVKVKQALETARKFARSNQQARRKAETERLIQKLVSASKPMSFTFKEQRFEGFELDNAVFSRLSKSVQARSTVHLMGPDNEARQSIDASKLKQIDKLSAEWKFYDIYFAAELGLVVKYTGKHGNGGHLVLRSEGPVEITDPVVVFSHGPVALAV